MSKLSGRTLAAWILITIGTIAAVIGISVNQEEAGPETLEIVVPADLPRDGSCSLEIEIIGENHNVHTVCR